MTWLVVSGAHPKTAQILASQASIEMTMQIYTDLKLLDFKGAVAALPDLGDGHGGEQVTVEEVAIRTTKRVG